MVDLESKFDDIEMLEIPDEETTSSETESMSESQNSSSGSENRDTSKQPRTYIELKDWILTSKPLDFQFNSNEYKQSLTEDDDFSKAHTMYVNSLYKIIEGLSDVNVSKVPLEEEKDYPPIGVISDSPDIGRNALKEYRNQKLSEAFLKLVEFFQEFLKHIAESVETEKYQRYHLLLNILDCIYANIFCKDVRFRPELLCKWVNRYDSKPDQELVEEIMINSPKPYLHAQFWNTYLAQLITRGCFNEATDVLKNSKFEELEETEPSLYSIIQDFQTLIGNYQSLSLKGQFREWILKASELRDSYSNFKADIKGSENVLIADQIYELVCGITGLTKTLSALTSTWYELFLALSLYHTPDDELVTIENYNIAIREKPAGLVDDFEDDEEILVEHAFINILEANLLKVLETIAIFDQATAAYVSRLFELKGVLTSYYQGLFHTHTANELLSKRTVSEYLLTKNAYENLNFHPLVPAGLGILMNPDISLSVESAKNNRKVISDFLPNFDFKTNDDLEWGLTICAKLNLVSTAKKLYLKYGKKSLKDGHIYEALNMFVQCYDPDSGSEESSEGMTQVHDLVWNSLFQDSLINNRPVKDELINNIVEHKVDEKFEIHPVNRQCLSPYAVLIEFFKSLEKIDESTSPMKVLSKLVHLIRFNHLPKKFIPLLLAQILPFFHNKKIGKFQLPDLIIITELIDNYESQATVDELIQGDEVYKYSIQNYEKQTSSYDWRILLKESHIEIPTDSKSLTRSLRNELVAKIGKVFIDK